MSKSKSTNTASQQDQSLNAIKTLEVRHPHPGKMFFFTGNAVCLQCLVIRQQIDAGYNIGPQYRPVADSVSNELACWIQSVLFQQAVTESGTVFAYPQVLYNGLNNEDWKACGSEYFQSPAWHWLEVVTSADGIGISGDSMGIVENEIFPHREFTRRLNRALAPAVIDTIEHPLIIRLKSLFGNVEEEVEDELHQEVETEFEDDMWLEVLS